MDKQSSPAAIVTNPTVDLVRSGTPLSPVPEGTIGRGNFAKVKLARHKLTQVEVAIKIIQKANLTDANLSKLMREVRIMKMLNHPNIVKLYEVIDTSDKLYLVMEYASGGEVFDYLVNHGRMKEKEARIKFRQIISALQYCHSKGIVHRDLKAENLLLSEDMNIKIADFGFANTYHPEQKLDTFCGSPPYAAPELFQGKEYSGPEVDVWSLGVILYTLVSGTLPFDGATLKDLRARVLRGKYRIPFFMSTECEDLLKKFLILNPDKRANLETILSDKWLNTGFENDPLHPFQESPLDQNIEDRLVAMEGSGFRRADVQLSLREHLYDHNTATYILLGHAKAKVQRTKAKPACTKTQRPVTSSAVPVHALTQRRQSIAVTAKSDAFSGATGSKKLPSPPMRHFSMSSGPGIKHEGEMETESVEDDPLSVTVCIDTTKSGANSALERHIQRLTLQGRRRTMTEGASPQDDQDESQIDTPSSSRRQHTPERPALFSRIRNSFRRDSVRQRTRPRSLRFSFSTANTSSKEPEALMDELKRVLDANQIKYELSDGPFALVCSHRATQFEMEVCKLPRLSLNGIRHKRIAGSSVDYKTILSKILNEMNL